MKSNLQIEDNFFMTKVLYMGIVINKFLNIFGRLNLIFVVGLMFTQLFYAHDFYL